MGKIIPLEKRLWERVDKSAGPDGCWLWTGSSCSLGYGHIGAKPRFTTVLVHRIVYELTYGDVPDSIKILHRCDNPRCCNPAHLFPGTLGENNKDRSSKGRTRNAVGESNPLAKLTDEQVNTIRTRYVRNSRTDGLAQLSLDYGVSGTRISMIVRGKAWRHLPQPFARTD